MHALRIGSYTRGPAGLERVGDVRVETTGTTTYLLDLPVADLHLLNDGDLTFASVRTDESSLQVLLAHAGSLPEPVNRALAVATGLGHAAQGRAVHGRPARLPAVAAGDRAEPQRRRALLLARAEAPPSSGARRC